MSAGIFIVSMESLLEANKELCESFAKSVANIISYYQGTERDSMLNRLRGELEKCCNMEEKLKSEERISQKISSYDQETNDDDDDDDDNDDDDDDDDDDRNNVEDYKSQIAQIVPDLSKNENIKEFDRIVIALLKADGNGNESDAEDDAELQLTRDTMNFIDPVTKKRMTDPVKNTICSHIYDRESVVALLKMNSLSRCPVPGCKYEEALSMDNMKTDIVTKTYLEKHPA